MKQEQLIRFWSGPRNFGLHPIFDFAAVAQS